MPRCVGGARLNVAEGGSVCQSHRGTHTHTHYRNTHTLQRHTHVHHRNTHTHTTETHSCVKQAEELVVFMKPCITRSGREKGTLAASVLDLYIPLSSSLYLLLSPSLFHLSLSLCFSVFTTS